MHWHDGDVSDPTFGQCHAGLVFKSIFSLAPLRLLALHSNYGNAVKACSPCSTTPKDFLPASAHLGTRQATSWPDKQCYRLWPLLDGSNKVFNYIGFDKLGRPLTTREDALRVVSYTFKGTNVSGCIATSQEVWYRRRVNKTSRKVLWL